MVRVIAAPGIRVHSNAMRKFIPIAAALALSACGQSTPDAAGSGQESSAQDAFWASLSSHCGKAYAGQLTSDDAADASMRGAEMVMHVRTCSDDQITVPFHIREQGGEWDRSRTWVFTRIAADTGPALRLRHDHRHADGEPDSVTLYGGDTATPGTAQRQSFPVDEESIAMFGREGLTASVTNIWSVEVDPADAPDARYVYQLTRTKAGGPPEDRDFRVVFDATTPIAPPPAPWGFEDAE